MIYNSSFHLQDDFDDPVREADEGLDQPARVPGPDLDGGVSRTGSDEVKRLARVDAEHCRSVYSVLSE